LINQLQAQYISCQPETVVDGAVQSGQSVAKTRTPGQFEQGVSRSMLFDYSYTPGDLIVVNRPNQSLCKILTPGRLDHGLSQSRLLHYSYVPGDLIVCTRGIDLWINWKGPIEVLKIDLPDQPFQAIAQEAGADSIAIASSTNYKDGRIGALISAFQAEKDAGSLSGRIYLDSIAQALAAALVQSRGVLRRPLRDVKSRLSPTQVAKVTELVHSHFDRELSLAELAAAAGLSTSYFIQVFHRSTGQTPHQFVLTARIERAKELLKGSQRVIDVALSCGFQTPQHFARVFRAVCKVSPTEYRRNVIAVSSTQSH
jgi:AraC family transcriptional regulator